MQLSRRECLVLAASLACNAQKARQGLVILLIGAPGSGKSTQANFLRQRYQIPTISAEELIAGDPSALARARNPKIQGIEARSDPALNELLRRRLGTIKVMNGFALDGYPATKDHADYLIKLTGDLALADPIAILLDIPDDEARKRLTKRGAKDDTPEVIEQRIKDYHREMDFLPVYFPSIKIHKLDGAKKPDQISKELKKILDPYLKN